MNTHNDIENQFETTLAQHDDLIRRICAAYSTKRTSPDDLYQEVTLSLWRGIKEFRGDAAVSTWVYRIAINTCISFLRHNERSSYNPVDIDAAFDLAADDNSPDNDDTSFLHLLIDHLNDIDKAIILMWLDGCPYAEISRVTGLNRTVVGTRLTRIRAKLRRAFEIENSHTYHANK